MSRISSDVSISRRPPRDEEPPKKRLGVKFKGKNPTTLGKQSASPEARAVAAKAASRIVAILTAGISTKSLLDFNHDGKVDWKDTDLNRDGHTNIKDLPLIPDLNRDGAVNLKDADLNGDGNIDKKDIYQAGKNVESLFNSWHIESHLKNIRDFDRNLDGKVENSEIAKTIAQTIVEPAPGKASDALENGRQKIKNFLDNLPPVFGQ